MLNKLKKQTRIFINDLNANKNLKLAPSLADVYTDLQNATSRH